MSDTPQRIPDWLVDARLADENRKLRREALYWREVAMIAQLLVGFAIGVLVVMIAIHLAGG